MKMIFLFLLLPAATGMTFAQPRTDKFMQDLLAGSKDSLVGEVLKHPETYRCQIIYTQINRDKKNKPSFTNYYYGYDSLQYFNPASTVKLPLAFLSLEKLHKLRSKGVDMNTIMQYDSSYSRQVPLNKDSTAENGKPSLAQFIRKAFLISDNDAYTRMYEFVGQETINRRLHAMGYPDLRITRRFMRMSPEENRHTNQVNFLRPDGSVIYTQPPVFNRDSFDFSHVNKMGMAYYNADDSLVHQPIDFTMANNITVYHLQQLLQSVLFPVSVPARQRFDHTLTDQEFLYRFLSQYPSETQYPKYDTTVYYDSYVKFFFRDSTHRMPPGIRVFNKVGWAYGCLTDVSYVADFKNKIEFMLTATIYVNSDGVLNDDKYDYDTIGWPFLYKLGQYIYQYELGRPRKYKPDLSRFKMDYYKRAEDGRPAVRNADN
jgi:hypothetical protein